MRLPRKLRKTRIGVDFFPHRIFGHQLMINILCYHHILPM